MIYDRLDIKLEEKGESFYNPLLKPLVEELIEKKIAVESDGAICAAEALARGAHHAHPGDAARAGRREAPVRWALRPERAAAAARRRVHLHLWRLAAPTRRRKLGCASHRIARRLSCAALGLGLS